MDFIVCPLCWNVSGTDSCSDAAGEAELYDFNKNLQFQRIWEPLELFIQKLWTECCFCPHIIIIVGVIIIIVIII